MAQHPDYLRMFKADSDRGDMDLPAGALIALGPGVAHTAKAHTADTHYIRAVMKLDLSINRGQE